MKLFNKHKKIQSILQTIFIKLETYISTHNQINNNIINSLTFYDVYPPVMLLFRIVVYFLSSRKLITEGVHFSHRNLACDRERRLNKLEKLNNRISHK